MRFDPIYHDKKYINKRDILILDYINFDEYSEEFITRFIDHQFENVFKENINEYLYKMVSKITNFDNLGNILSLININNIGGDNIEEYLRNLIIKFNKIFEKETEASNIKIDNENKKKEINVIIKFLVLLCNFGKWEKSYELLGRIKKYMDNNICNLIYIILFHNLKKKKHKKIKKFILKKLFSDSEINVIVKVFESYLKEERGDEENEEEENRERREEENEEREERFEKKGNRDFIFNELIKICEFSVEEFYSKEKNNKFELLSYLFGIYQDRDNFLFERIENMIDIIFKELNEGYLKKNQLEEFLSNEEIVVKNKLNLIKIIIFCFNPEEKYSYLKKINDEINKNIEKLTSIKDNLVLYFNNEYSKEIEDITNYIKKIEVIQIKDFYREYNRRKIIELIDKWGSFIERINKVKNFELFNAIYQGCQIKDEYAQISNPHNINIHFHFIQKIKSSNEKRHSK